MDDLSFGLQVTVLGLGIVFGLLALLWLLLSLALRFELRSQTRGAAAGELPAAVDGPAAETGAPPAVAVRPLDGAAEPDPALVAAIAVAVARHADQRRRQAAPAMRSYWPGSLLFASRWVAAGRMRQGQAWRGRGR